MLLRLLAGLAVVSIFVAGGMLLFDFIKTQHKFPPKSFISHVDVSGLSPDEAILKLKESSIEVVFPGTVTFVASPDTFSCSPKDLGIFFMPEDTVREIFDSARNAEYFQNLESRITKGYISFPAKFSYAPEKVKEIISEIASQINTPAVDARISLNESTGGYHIYPEKIGREVDVETSLSWFRDYFGKSYFTIPLCVNNTGNPRITEAMLRKFPPVHKLSSYTTYYGTHDSPNRIHNIKLIASWLQNTIMFPDEVLSLVAKVGDFTAERGFKEAYVISNGELVPQLGGGTCQIGTTLYNAVALADLHVISRRNHSFYFNIYPLGRDATVYPGSADFKFKNNTGHIILIKTVANNKKLSFRIYGTPTGKSVDFTGPAIYMLYGGAFRPASLRQVIASDLPFRTVVIRTVKNSSGEVIEKETIRSYYKLYGEKANVPIRRRESR